MRRALWAIPIAVFFLNPSFACGPSDDAPQFHFDATEMRAAVEANWSFTIMPEGAAGPIQVTVKVEQAATAPAAQARAPRRSLVRAAHACGTRTLVKGAAACVDVSAMPLTVTFVSGDASFASAPLSGLFQIMGAEFNVQSTLFQLVLGDYHIEAQLEPNGELVNPHVVPVGSRGSLTIVTRA
jgi:hypothetical protein